jgi:hypothetical protein
MEAFMKGNSKLVVSVPSTLPEGTVSDLQLLRQSAISASEKSLAAQRQVATSSPALSPPPDIEGARQLAMEEHRCWLRYLNAFHSRMKEFDLGKFG